MSGSLNQTFKYDYNSTAVTVRLENTSRNFTPEEMAEAQKIFAAAREFVARLYADGTLRPEEDF